MGALAIDEDLVQHREAIMDRDLLGQGNQNQIGLVGVIYQLAQQVAFNTWDTCEV